MASTRTASSIPKANPPLFKWYWLPALGHRSLVYDEVQKLQGKNNNFQRVDLYNNIAAGNFPEWDFAVQIFPDDGTYMYKGYDLLIPTVIVPFEMNQPMRLGKLTLNRNPTNFFAEPESISFAPSNVVKGVSFVPDPLLQWRLMSYDDTSTHRHNSPNGYLLPINRAIAPNQQQLPRWIHAASTLHRQLNINTKRHWRRPRTRRQRYVSIHGQFRRVCRLRPHRPLHLHVRLVRPSPQVLGYAGHLCTTTHRPTHIASSLATSLIPPPPRTISTPSLTPSTTASPAASHSASVP